MDKNAIKRFTEWAKIELTKAVKQKAFEYGIFEKSIIDSNSIIGEKVLTSIEQKQRKELVKQINENGYDAVIEEITYTWFNRFIALRFMEVNGYLPTRVRVFSDDENNFNPQILKEALTIELDNIDKTIVIDYLTKNNNEALYKYLLIAQCNSLNRIIPTLFEKIENYTELLFPDNLLKKNSVLEHLVTDIKEEDWKEQVQILGWIYQFYVESKKNTINTSNEVITKETLPAVTQLFTPDWIVRYMAENSLGRVWLESYPNSSLKDNMKYYVDDAEQDEEVQKQLDKIKYKNVTPEDIKVIEPCCGSGHILVYIFDLLYKMYEEKGYKKADIPTLIFKNNIWGLDIDKRASQLANFSLLMKARSMDNRFFSRDKIAKPKIYEIIDSQNIKKTNYMEIMDEAGFTKETIAIAKYLVDTYENAKVIGSLLKVNIKDYSSFVKELREKKKEGLKDLFHTEFYEHTIAKLIKLAKLASTMSRKYDVMITNPPYLGSSSLEPKCKDYAIKYYPDSKTDMFAMFMEVGFPKANGFMAMINMHSWMFLKSYETLRKNIIEKSMIVNMLHLGAHAFEEINGEVVQTTSFVLRNTPIATNGIYFRLVDSKDKVADFLKNIGVGYVVNLHSFYNIPGNPFAYWVNKKMLLSFKMGKKLEDIAIVRNGLKTGDNNQFVRLWFEVSQPNSFLYATDYIQAMYSGKTWFPYNKGGEYRKWYGNNEYVVNWKNKGQKVISEAKKDKRNVQDYPDAYKFLPIVSWSLITSYKPSFRKKQHAISDISGMSLYKLKDEEIDYCLGFVNSCVSLEILGMFNPTLNFQAGDIGRLPIVIDENHKDKIEQLVNQNTSCSKDDWDSFETSWDFKKHPLV